MAAYERFIFVFGSNRQGRHGAGAALVARRKYGAIYGQAQGLQGDSYAIITKELRGWMPPVSLAEVRTGVERFLQFADENPKWEFFVTPIGCGLAGFVPGQIAPLFAGAPENVKLPQVFLDVLANLNKKSKSTVKERADHACLGDSPASGGL